MPEPRIAAGVDRKMKGAHHCPLQATEMEAPIPITIPLDYHTYSRLAAQGLLSSYLGQTICPHHPHGHPPQAPPEPLRATRSMVDRTAFLLEKDAYDIDNVVQRSIRIVLAVCPVCKSRCRLLPADILPFKLYSVPVIEVGVRFYNRGDLSLRQVAWDRFYGDRTPEHTTLHGWTEGLGAWLQGRGMGQVAFSLPAGRIEAELKIRFPQIAPLHSIAVRIDPRRYRSQARKERLQACKRIEIVDTLFDAPAGRALCELNRLVVGWNNRYGLGFPTGIGCTPVEHITRTDVPPWPQTSKKEPVACPIRGRSPPGDSK